MSLQRQILVVDDSTLIRAMLVDVLGDEGYRVTTVCSGEDALDVGRLEQPARVRVLLAGAGRGRGRGREHR